jgi:hypothetical protein
VAHSRATALSAALDALDERLLVGTDVPDLSTLAGARSGTIGATLSTRRQKFELQPFETRVSGEATAYLKVEKPRFLFLEGSAGAVAAAGGAVTALPDASAAHAGASAACAASSVERLAAGTSTLAPGTCTSVASVALGEGGAGSHLSGACPPSLSSASPSPDDEYSEVAGGESPCCSHSRYSSFRCSQRSRRRILRSFLRAARSCSRRCAARALGLGAWAGRTARHPRPPSAKKSETLALRWHVARE